MLTICLGILTISGGQFIILFLRSIFHQIHNDNLKQPTWFTDTLTIQDKAAAIFKYLIGFSFFAFWGLTVIFIASSILSLLPKRLWVDRIFNGLLTFGIMLIISVGLGYYAALDNLDILTTSFLGLIFGSTILTRLVRQRESTYA